MVNINKDCESKETGQSITTMESIIEDATLILEDFGKGIPTHYFKHCFGIVVLSSAEVACLFNGDVGSGVLIRHDPMTKYWSPPCAIGLNGVGVGFNCGAEKKDAIFFLLEPETIVEFEGNLQVRLGSQTSFALGSLDIDTRGGSSSHHLSKKGLTRSSPPSCYTKGLYAGSSDQNSIMTPRKYVNKKFYGETKSAKILSGDVRPLRYEYLLEDLEYALNEIVDNDFQPTIYEESPQSD
mmetsp:Transcript_17392/g.25119  ORF Transcript_17392/g.25119 Transcript_17392/m.25119 type:complete len:239 (+) Transcript_17392:49-765(+)